MDGINVADMFDRKNVPVHIRRSRGIRQAIGLAKQINYVHSETVGSLIQPPGHHVVYVFSDIWIVPVQVRLLF